MNDFQKISTYWYYAYNNIVSCAIIVTECNGKLKLPDRGAMPATDLTKACAVLNRHLQMQYAKELPAVGVRYGLMGYIMCIHNNPGITQERMAPLMAVERSSVTKAVKQLEAEGYVTREVNPDCRREYILTPTAKLKQAYAKILPIKKKVHARVTGNMTDIERDLFLRLLAKINLE